MSDQAIALIVLGAGTVIYSLGCLIDAAVSSLNRTRIRSLMEFGGDRATKNAGKLDAMVDRPTQILMAAQLSRLTGAVLIAAMVIYLRNLDERAGLWEGIIAATFVVIVLLILRAILRLFAVHNPEGMAIILYPAIVAQSLTIGLGSRTLLHAQARFASRLGMLSVVENPTSSTEIFQIQTASARELGLINEDGNEMIQSIFEMVTTTVREVMVPRIDAIALPASASLDLAIDTMRERGYSRLPVYEGTIDNVIGILYAKDLFRYVQPNMPGEPIRPLIRPAYFIPESKKNADLLRELQTRHVHMAIVADEYGGTAGVVTIEDLLEEIVGEIQDEYDTHEESKIIKLNEDESIIDAKMSISDVNDELELSLQSEDVDTIGGLLYEKLGRLPMLGDQAEVEGALLQVESTSGRRMRKVRITRRRSHDVEVGANN